MLSHIRRNLFFVVLASPLDTDQPPILIPYLSLSHKEDMTTKSRTISWTTTWVRELRRPLPNIVNDFHMVVSWSRKLTRMMKRNQTWRMLGWMIMTRMNSTSSISIGMV
ncbi:hypothetical protein CPB85DRAFT_549791 [Mucidula mucida]|nr:hypothetical protein CPB85DRAFT_549791 [Mucidula mucida]